MDYNELITNGKPVIKSKIDGNFEGFDDEKLFPLYNGQYWIQKSYKYWYHYSEAIIYSNGYDYKIVVEGKRVGVKKLK